MYFSLPHVSNSDLKALGRSLKLLEPITSSGFKMGNLVDQLVTEPEKPVIYEDFTTDEVKKALLMRDKVKDHIALKNCQMQHVILRERFIIEYNGLLFTLRAKCKYDGLNKAARMGVDLKSTACTSRKSFIESIFYFDYDQQAAWYMDLGKLDRFWFIGVSKCKKPKEFNFVVERGDDVYNSGLKKYSYLGYQYFKYLL